MSESPSPLQFFLIFLFFFSSPGCMLTISCSNGGARIYYIFNETFVRQIQAVNPAETLSDQQIRIVLRNAAVCSSSHFVYHSFFSPPSPCITPPLFVVLICNREHAHHSSSPNEPSKCMIHHPNTYANIIYIIFSFCCLFIYFFYYFTSG